MPPVADPEAVVLAVMAVAPEAVARVAVARAVDPVADTVARAVGPVARAVDPAAVQTVPQAVLQAPVDRMIPVPAAVAALVLAAVLPVLRLVTTPTLNASHASAC